VDIGAAVRAELARQREAEAEAAAEAAWRRAACPSGACWLCGLSHCETYDERGRVVSPWHEDTGGRFHCEACDRDLFDRVGWTDADRKVSVMLDLLGLRHAQPLRAVGDPSAFGHIAVWWSEHDGARPVDAVEERFSHVNTDRLREAFTRVAEGHEIPLPPAPPEPEPLRPHPCPSCGGFRWATELGRGIYCTASPLCGFDGFGNYGRVNLPTLNDTAGPGSRPRHDDIVARLLGVWAPVSFGLDPLLGLAERVGFRYFHEARGAGWPDAKPNEQPWGHVDLRSMHRRLEKAGAAC
jgi:hypothetical protein